MKRARKFEEELEKVEEEVHRKNSGEEFEDMFEDEYEQEDIVENPEWEDVEDE